MRSKNRELMLKIRDYADGYYRDRRESPSTTEIAETFGIGRGTAYKYLVEMNERGLINYKDGNISTEKTSKCKTGYFSAPIVGSIRCGNPETQDEYVEEYVSLPVSVFGKGQFYVLRADGDSMVDVGIEDKDLVVIRVQTEAEIGDVVVALDENNENTLKTYAGIDEGSGYAILKYENENKYPDEKIYVTNLVVQGVAKHIIKSL